MSCGVFLSLCFSLSTSFVSLFPNGRKWVSVWELWNFRQCHLSDEILVIVLLCFIYYLVRLGLICDILYTMGMLCLWHLGFKPFGPYQYHLWYRLMWDKILRLDLVPLSRGISLRVLVCLNFVIDIYIYQCIYWYIYQCSCFERSILFSIPSERFIRSHFRLIWIVFPKVW